MKNVRYLIVLVGMMVGLCAQADRKFYYVNKNTSAFNTYSRYDDPSTGTTLTAFDTEGDYWLKGGMYMRSKAHESEKTFNGAEFNIGSPSVAPDGWNTDWGKWWGSTKGYLYSWSYGTTYGPMTINNLVWWNGKLYVHSNNGDANNYVEYMFKLCGTWTIRQADSGVTHLSYMSQSHPYVEFNATVRTSDEDAEATNAVWTICDSSSTILSSEELLDRGTNYVFRMTGDHSAYKGSINVTAQYQPIVIYNGTIIGDETVGNLAAIKLGNNAAIAFAADFEQGTTRGIQLTGARAHLATWETLANEYTISYPISKADGVDGALIKRGSGTVTIDGAYTAGAITVHEGTLIIGPNASFAAGTAIEVEAGATLKSHLSLESFELTGEGVKEYVALEVPFDPTAEGTKTTPVTLTNAVGAAVQPIALSTQVPLPQHEALKLPVATYSGEKTLEPTMFSDVTAKTDGLPKTSFSVESEGGVQTLYLNVRPVVVSMKTFDSYTSGKSTIYVGFNGLEGDNYWSDSHAAHTGADYLMTTNMYRIINEDFNGDSLTIGTTSFEQEFRLRSNALLPDVTIYPQTRIIQGSNPVNPFTVRGSAFLIGEYGDNYTLDMRNKYNDGKAQTIFDATLLGAGTFQLSQNNKATESIESYTKLTCDNSSYYGKIMAVGNGPLRIQITDAKNLGGKLEEFKYDALTMSSSVYLKPLNTMTLSNDVNRGIYVKTRSGFDVPTNVTFTCLRPIKADGDIVLRGAGTMLLGGEVTLGSSAGEVDIIEPAGIGALSDAAVSGLTLTATNDFTIVVSPKSTAVNGFTGIALSGETRPKIHVRFAKADAEAGKCYQLPICTLDDSLGVTAADFDIEAARGYETSIVTESVEGDKTRYLLNLEKVGLVITIF